MVVQIPVVLYSGGHYPRGFRTLDPNDTVPGTDTTAQASGNAALVLAGTALASGNAGLVSASNKVPISGGYMTGQLFAASGVVVSGTLSRNGFNVVTVGDVETVTSTMIASGTIIDADVNISGAINATKLSFLQAGTGATARTVDSKFKEYLSVKDFGVTGDGVTDDTVNIRKAFDHFALQNGGVLLFPPGVYLVSSTIFIPRFNVAPGPSTPSQGSGALFIGYGAVIRATGALANTALVAGGNIFETAQQTYSTGATSNFGFNEIYPHYSSLFEGFRFENCGRAFYLFNFIQNCVIRYCNFVNVKTAIYAERSFYCQIISNSNIGCWRPSSGSFLDPLDASFVFKGFVNVQNIQGNAAIGAGGSIPDGSKGIGFTFTGGTSGLIATNNSAEGFDVGLYIGSFIYGALFHGWYCEGNNVAIQVKDSGPKRNLEIDGFWFNDDVAIEAETWISGSFGSNNYISDGTVNINNPFGNATNAALNTCTVHLPNQDIEQGTYLDALPSGWDIGGGVRIVRNASVYNSAGGPIANLALQNQVTTAGGPSKAYIASATGQGSFTAGVPFCQRITNSGSIDFLTNIGYNSGYESGINFDFTIIADPPISTRRLSGTIAGTSVFRHDSDATLSVAASASGSLYLVTINNFPTTSGGVSVAGGIRVV